MDRTREKETREDGGGKDGNKRWCQERMYVQ